MHIAVALLIAFFIFAPARSAWTQTVDRHGEPSVACNPDGGFVVVWHSRGQDGDGYGVLQRSFDGDGNGGPESIVNTYTSDDQRRAAVCSAPGGSFVVAWQSYGQDGDGDGIFARSFDSLGVPRAEDFQVSTGSNNAQEEADLACASDGGFVVVWTAGGTDGEGYGIVGRRFSSSGSSPHGDFNVNSYTATNQIAPSVSTLPDGGFVVVWTSYDGQDGAAYGVFGQRFSSAGAKDGSEFQVNTYTSNSQLAPAVAADASGRFVVAWSSAQDVDGGYDVIGQRFAANGARDGGEVPVNMSTPGDQGASFGTGRVLDVATAGDQGFAVVWQSQNVTGAAPDGDGIGVFSQRFTGSAAPIGSEFQVNTATVGDQGYPSLCVTTAGEMVVAWESRGGEIDGIFAQRYDSAGAPVGSEIRVSTDTAGPYSDCAAGDCNQSNDVTVNELVFGVNIALGRAALSGCPFFDTNESMTVTVDELVLAVRAALEGCEAPTPIPTATPRVIEERTRRHGGKPPVNPEGTPYGFR